MRVKSWKFLFPDPPLSVVSNKKIHDVLSQVRHLRIQIRKNADESLLGAWKSRFKGQGMTFADFREYVPGDDVRHISWVLTARPGRTYIKKFDEEREQSIIIVTDRSGSMGNASSSPSKHDCLVRLASTLVVAAMHHRDPVGLLIFSDQVDHWVPPGKKKMHIERFIRDVLYFSPKTVSTQFNEPFRFLQKTLKKKSVIFIISDFLTNPDCEASLKSLLARHEVYPIVIEDDWEKQPPSLGLMRFFDPESGQQQWCDTLDYSFREGLRKSVESVQDSWRNLFQKLGLRSLRVSTKDDLVRKLREFLIMR